MASSETAKLRKRMRDLENELDDLRGRGRGRGTDAGRGRGEDRGGQGEGRGGRGVAAAPAAAVAPAAANEKKPGLIALPVCLDDIASTPAADLEPTLAAASSSAAAGNPAESLARHRVRSDESELADSYQATVDGFAVQQLRVLPADHLSSHRYGGVAAKVTAFGLGLGLGQP